MFQPPDGNEGGKMMRPQLLRRRGFSLVEVLVGITMLTGALLGLAAAASNGIRQNTRARDDSQEWADAQQVIDSVVALGWGNVPAGERTTVVRSRSIIWNAAAPTTSTQKISFWIPRSTYQTKTGSATRYGAATDTVVLYLSTPTT
jgi:Tfp pilus assembly protein PilV